MRSFKVGVHAVTFFFFTKDLQDTMDRVVFLIRLKTCSREINLSEWQEEEEVLRRGQSDYRKIYVSRYRDK